MQIRGDPLQEALSRAHADNEALTSSPLPTGCEREICDRPTATANTALVRCMAFGPPIHHRLRPPAAGTTASAPDTIETSQLLGSFFAATAGGAAFVFALFADNVRRPSHLASRQATQIQLQHRAPIVALRLIDTKTHCPLLTSCESDLFLLTFLNIHFCDQLPLLEFISHPHIDTVLALAL